MQNVRVCYIAIHVPWWFVASISPSSTLGISPVIPPQSPHPLPSLPYPPPPSRPWCVMFPSLCPCVLTVQHPLISENMQCLVFYYCVNSPRIMASSYIWVSAKDIISFFFCGCMYTWYICKHFSLSNPLPLGTWVDFMFLLL